VLRFIRLHRPLGLVDEGKSWFTGHLRKLVAKRAQESYDLLMERTGKKRKKADISHKLAFSTPLSPFRAAIPHAFAFHVCAAFMGIVEESNRRMAMSARRQKDPKTAIFPRK
jgi:hypothetical protein